MTAEWVRAIADIGTAIGTVGAVIVALFLAGADGRRRRQEAERKQAERISAWLIDDLPAPEKPGDEWCMRLLVRNASDELVYNLIASLVNAQTEARIGQGTGHRAFVGRVPPGASEFRIQHPGHAMGGKKFGIELAFEDSGGRTWIRRGKGSLEPVNRPVHEVYDDISPPFGWQMP